MTTHGSSQCAIHCVKRGTLLFWALWFSFAWLSNFFDLLKQMNVIPSTWLFVSGNFTLVANVLSIYKLPPVMSYLLFLGVLALEALIVIAFWAAFCTFSPRRANRFVWVNRAFLLSAALWAMFLVTEELFIAYLYEQTHLLLFIAQILCLMMMHAFTHDPQST